jgi:hypothetical protein
MRPARRFGRGEGGDSGDVDPNELIAAMDRLREALEPGELRDLLDRRRSERRTA